MKVHFFLKLFCWLSAVGTISLAFLAPRQPHRIWSKSMFHSQGDNEESSSTMLAMKRLEVVVFGVGDLRTIDHGGLSAATKSLRERGDAKILPVVFLDPALLQNIPDVRAHTLDTAALLHSAVFDLKTQLQSLDMDLCVSTDKVSDTIQRLSSLEDEVHLHVCDLDLVDNSLGYGPFSIIETLDLPSNMKLHPWTCHLREKPWEMVDTIPMEYPKYETDFMTEQPGKVDLEPDEIGEGRCRGLDGVSGIPSIDAIVDAVQSALSLYPANCKAETNSGLYGTHWGGLPARSIGELQVRRNLVTFVTACLEDDDVYARDPDYIGRSVTRNGLSLEHASICWMMKGDGKEPTTTTENLMAGEAMTRYLMAPLLFGTVSPRIVWVSSRVGTSNGFPSPLRTLVEIREWHKLLAAHNKRTGHGDKDENPLRFDYFRWHGFLCRYAKTRSSKSKIKDGLVLVHGFGASSLQWTKLFKELGTEIEAGLAPDLIGFGQSEKPPITFTQYCWEAYVGDFVKEIALGKEEWESYTIGGNSIGGYTSMGTAADDSVSPEDVASSRLVSSRGGAGTGKCNGLVLMNSAGRLQSKEELEAMKRAGDKLVTMADITSIDGLPKCSPPPRPLARVFGNGLLWYLRPRIESICKQLYPTNPSAGEDPELCNNIRRDSLDPGAINIMMSGAKLPPPRTVNELLGADFGSAKDTTNREIREGMFNGPVLVTQGFLDPLNDAKGRASLLGALRDGIEVRPINGGHCPHDEMPQEVATSLLGWIQKKAVAA